MLDGPLPATGSMTPPKRHLSIRNFAPAIAGGALLFLGAIGMAAGSWASSDPLAHAPAPLVASVETLPPAAPIATPAPVVATAAPTTAPEKALAAAAAKPAAKKPASKPVAKKSAAKKPVAKKSSKKSSKKTVARR